MGTLVTTFIFLCSLLTIITGASVDSNLFASRVVKGLVTNPHEDDIVGMAASRTLKDVLWMVDSHEGDNYLFAVNANTGTELAYFNVTGAVNTDWEDMAYGPCADDCKQSEVCKTGTVSRYCIYIADIGGNTNPAKNTIYMVREPKDLLSSANGNVVTGDIPVVDKLTYSWAEPDAETLMIAPDAKLYVISKIDNGRGMIAHIPESGWGGGLAVIDQANTAVLKIYTQHHDPQGGSISPDGDEMILVCEEDVYYYSVEKGDFINAVRTQIPERVSSYVSEDDAEAITWSADAQGFYTFSKHAKEYIYYYPRNSNIIG